MSKVEQLIHTLCPNGVEYKKLKEIAEMKRGTSLTKAKAIEGDFPVISGGREPAFYCNTFNRSGETITVAGSGAGAGYVQYWTIELFANDCFTIKGREVISTKYLYYCLANMQEKIYDTKKGGGVPHVHISDIENFKLPVPPLEIQEEIVKTLDKFTNYVTELQAELQARKQQYEYYRDALLSVEKEQCKASKLNEIADIYDGTHQTPEYKGEGIPFISVENIESIYSSNKYISEEAFKRYKIKPQVNDLFMTRIGSIGKCAVMTKERELAYYVSLALIRPNQDIVDTRYLKHYIESTLGSKELAKRTLHNAVPIKINKEDIGKIVIRYPRLEIQQKIVSVLDNFDAICSDLNIGLPAEIEARQKQYEFYRDALLTFAETGTIIAQTDRQTDRQTLIRLIQYVFGWVQIDLATVGKVSMCKRIMKSETSPTGDIPFYKIGTFGKEADAYISKQKYDEYRKAYSYPQKGEILISASGTIGRTVVYNGEEAYYQDSNIVWIANDESLVLNRYLLYYYQLQPWNISTGGTIARLYNDNISRAKICVPTIKEQKRIIEILDRFDLLCNDISEGLPAEIEARQKQYEYYRDKLLNFKELSI